MLKYLMAFVLLVGASVFITGQHEKQAENSATPRAQRSDPTAAPAESEQAKSNVKDTKWYSPSGDVAFLVFGFPNGITVWALLLTMMVISEQTYQTRRSADAGVRASEAANRSVAIFISAQEPQIWVTAHGNPARNVFGTDVARVELEMSNKGPTTAENLSYESWIEVLPSESEDFTDLACHWKGSPPLSLSASQQPVILNIPLDRAFDEIEKTEIRQLRKKVCLRVRVTYRDIFSPEIRYVNFGYVVQHDGLGFLAKYNDRGTEPNYGKKQK